jgi:hypothetical protein
MHSYTSKTDGETIHFNYNSDFSGDVRISKEFLDEANHVISIPGQAILDFIARCFVGPEMTTRLECRLDNASPEEILLGNLFKE